MPTKLISKALLGALSAAVMSAPAFAGGNCGSGNCGVPVQVMPSMPAQFGPMTVQNQNPMGHLRSIHFQRAPHVSITRVHGMGPTAGLSDAPSGFTDGCHPTSTTYCRHGGNHAAPAPMPAPVMPAPVVSAPVPSEPRVVRIGGGYDPSKFAPRTYGDASLVPGIAYLPTSKVVRDPAAAQQVLDTGRAVPQDVVVPGTGTAPNMGMVGQSMTTFQGGGQMAGLTQTQGLMLAPTRPGPSFGQPGIPVLQQSGPLAGSYGSSMAADGTYWEKVSGPTAFGDTIATSVICKRQAQRRLVRPVVNVPVPVPVAVPQVCRTTGRALPAPVAMPQGHFGQPAPGRWTY